MPPQYVKAYRKRHKNDAADAAAICEAVTRPSMRFVPIKTPEQQAALTIHRTRDLLMRQRTTIGSADRPFAQRAGPCGPAGLINALRGHLAEFGVIAPQGPRHVVQLIAAVRDEAEDRVPALARRVLAVLVEQLEELATRLAVVGRELLAWHRASPASQRLATIVASGNDPVPQGTDRVTTRSVGPGIGPVTASTLAATVPNPAAFRSGREFAAPSGLRSADPCGTGSIALRSMARAGAAAALERRQGAPGQDQQAGRCRAAPALDHRRPGGAALAQGGRGQPVAAVAARPAAAPGRGGGAGEQDGAHRPSAGCCRPLLSRRIDRVAVDGRSCAANTNSGPWRRNRRSGRAGLARARTRDGGSVVRGGEGDLVRAAGHRARQNVEASRRGTHQGRRS
jgi:transposase